VGELASEIRRQTSEGVTEEVSALIGIGVRAGTAEGYAASCVWQSEFFRTIGKFLEQQPTAKK